MNMVLTKNYLLSFIFILGQSVLFYSQENQLNEKNMVQLSGVIISEETLEPVPYTTVYDKTIRRGVVSDYYGYFSLVVYPGDSIIFANSNYANSSFVVPDTLKDNRYSIVHMVPASVLDLPEVKVYPWPSREDFARAFLEMDPYDDALRKAQRELSGESLAFAAAKLEGDASLAYGNSINERYTKLYTQGQLPVNNLFNPASWAKFIQDWKAGNLKIE